MKIKYSPCKSDKDTVIVPISENSISVNGELFEFDEESVEFDDLIVKTSKAILNAYRDENNDEELCLIVRRFYSTDCSEWDTGDYHDIVW